MLVDKYEMTRTRYCELSRDENLLLTTEEINSGWHFSADWDFMLIHPKMEESQGCCCKACIEWNFKHLDKPI